MGCEEDNREGKESANKRSEAKTQCVCGYEDCVLV